MKTKRVILFLMLLITNLINAQTPTRFTNKVIFETVPRFNPSVVIDKTLRNLFVDKNGNLVWDTIPKGGGSVTIPDVSGTVSGIVNNTVLQELGGTDKLINGQRAGRGNNNITTNTVFGSGTGNSITTGNNIAGFGTGALTSATTANANTAFGAYALYSNMTGINNTAIGNFALQNTLAANNTAIGYGAGAANTSGIRNTIVGTGASILSTSASNNTVIGAAAGQNNSTGGTNIFIGWMAGGNTTTGTSNTIIGTQATVGVGISTGNNNLIVSQNAGNSTGITTGNGNTVIGKVSGLTANSTNTVVLADGVGNITLQKNTNGEVVLPNVTNTLITSGGNKAIVTKEFLDTTIAGLPTPSTPTLQDILDQGDLTVNIDENLFINKLFSGPDINSLIGMGDGFVSLGVTRPSTDSSTSVSLGEQNVSIQATGNINHQAPAIEYSSPEFLIKNNTPAQIRAHYTGSDYSLDIDSAAGDTVIVLGGDTGEVYGKGGLFTEGYLNVEGISTLEGDINIRTGGTDEGIEFRRSGSSHTMEFIDATATPRLTLDNDGYLGAFSITTNNFFITEPGAGTLEFDSTNLTGNKTRTLANATGIELLTIQGVGASATGNIDIVVYYASSTALTNATLNSGYPNVPIGFRVLAPNVGTSMIYTKVTEAGTADVWLSQATSIVP